MIEEGREEVDSFTFYLKFAKPLVINLPDPAERALAAAWVKKLKDETSGSENVRKEYLKLLLFVLHRRHLIGPFLEDPSKQNLIDLTQDLNILDYAKQIILKEAADRRIQRALGAAGDYPPYSVECSSDLLEYAAAQDIPKFGVHAYYAISFEPLTKWDNADKAFYPKGAVQEEMEKSLGQAASAPAIGDRPEEAAGSPRRPRSPGRTLGTPGQLELPEQMGPPSPSLPSPLLPLGSPALSPPPPPMTSPRVTTPSPAKTPPKEKTPSPTLGAAAASPRPSPKKSSVKKPKPETPKSPFGSLPPPDDDRIPVTWASNLIDIADDDDVDFFSVQQLPDLSMEIGDMSALSGLEKLDSSMSFGGDTTADEPSDVSISTDLSVPRPESSSGGEESAYYDATMQQQGTAPQQRSMQAAAHPDELFGPPKPWDYQDLSLPLATPPRPPPRTPPRPSPRPTGLTAGEAAAEAQMASLFSPRGARPKSPEGIATDVQITKSQNPEAQEIIEEAMQSMHETPEPQEFTRRYPDRRTDMPETPSPLSKYVKSRRSPGTTKQFEPQQFGLTGEEDWEAATGFDFDVLPDISPSRPHRTQWKPTSVPMDKVFPGVKPDDYAEGFFHIEAPDLLSDEELDVQVPEEDVDVRLTRLMREIATNTKESTPAASGVATTTPGMAQTPTRLQTYSDFPIFEQEMPEYESPKLSPRAETVGVEQRAKDQYKALQGTPPASPRPPTPRAPSPPRDPNFDEFGMPLIKIPSPTQSPKAVPSRLPSSRQKSPQPSTSRESPRKQPSPGRTAAADSDEADTAGEEPAISTEVKSPHKVKSAAEVEAIANEQLADIYDKLIADEEPRTPERHAPLRPGQREASGGAKSKKLDFSPRTAAHVQRVEESLGDRFAIPPEPMPVDLMDAASNVPYYSGHPSVLDTDIPQALPSPMRAKYQIPGWESPTSPAQDTEDDEPFLLQYHVPPGATGIMEDVIPMDVVFEHDAREPEQIPAGPETFSYEEYADPFHRPDETEGLDDDVAPLLQTHEPIPYKDRLNVKVGKKRMPVSRGHIKPPPVDLISEEQEYHYVSPPEKGWANKLPTFNREVIYSPPSTLGQIIPQSPHLLSQAEQYFVGELEEPGQQEMMRRVLGIVGDVEQEPLFTEQEEAAAAAAAAAAFPQVDLQQLYMASPPKEFEDWQQFEAFEVTPPRPPTPRPPTPQALPPQAVPSKGAIPKSRLSKGPKAPPSKTRIKGPPPVGGARARGTQPPVGGARARDTQPPVGGPRASGAPSRLPSKGSIASSRVPSKGLIGKGIPSKGAPARGQAPPPKPVTPPPPRLPTPPPRMPSPQRPPPPPQRPQTPLFEQLPEFTFEGPVEDYLPKYKHYDLPIRPRTGPATPPPLPEIAKYRFPTPPAYNERELFEKKFDVWDTDIPEVEFDTGSPVPGTPFGTGFDRTVMTPPAPPRNYDYYGPPLVPPPGPPQKHYGPPQGPPYAYVAPQAGPGGPINYNTPVQHYDETQRSMEVGRPRPRTRRFGGKPRKLFEEKVGAEYMDMSLPYQSPPVDYYSPVQHYDQKQRNLEVDRPSRSRIKSRTVKKRRIDFNQPEFDHTTESLLERVGSRIADVDIPTQYPDELMGIHGRPTVGPPVLTALDTSIPDIQQQSPLRLTQYELEGWKTPPTPQHLRVPTPEKEEPFYLHLQQPPGATGVFEEHMPMDVVMEAQASQFSDLPEGYQPLATEMPFMYERPRPTSPNKRVITTSKTTKTPTGMQKETTSRTELLSTSPPRSIGSPQRAPPRTGALTQSPLTQRLEDVRHVSPTRPSPKMPPLRGSPLQRTSPAVGTAPSLTPGQRYAPPQATSPTRTPQKTAAEAAAETQLASLYAQSPPQRPGPSQSGMSLTREERTTTSADGTTTKMTKVTQISPFSSGTPRSRSPRSAGPSTPKAFADVGNIDLGAEAPPLEYMSPQTPGSPVSPLSREDTMREMIRRTRAAPGRIVRAKPRPVLREKMPSMMQLKEARNEPRDTSTYWPGRYDPTEGYGEVVALSPTQVDMDFEDYVLPSDRLAAPSPQRVAQPGVGRQQIYQRVEEIVENVELPEDQQAPIEMSPTLQFIYESPERRSPRAAGGPAYDIETEGLPEYESPVASVSPVGVPQYQMQSPQRSPYRTPPSPQRSPYYTPPQPPPLRTPPIFTAAVSPQDMLAQQDFDYELPASPMTPRQPQQGEPGYYSPGEDAAMAAFMFDLEAHEYTEHMQDKERALMRQWVRSGRHEMDLGAEDPNLTRIIEIDEPEDTGYRREPIYVREEQIIEIDQDEYDDVEIIGPMLGAPIGCEYEYEPMHPRADVEQIMQRYGSPTVGYAPQQNVMDQARPIHELVELPPALADQPYGLEEEEPFEGVDYTGVGTFDPQAYQRQLEYQNQMQPLPQMFQQDGDGLEDDFVLPEEAGFEVEGPAQRAEEPDIMQQAKALLARGIPYRSQKITTTQPDGSRTETTVTQDIPGGVGRPPQHVETHEVVVENYEPPTQQDVNQELGVWEDYFQPPQDNYVPYEPNWGNMRTPPKSLTFSDFPEAPQRKMPYKPPRPATPIPKSKRKAQKTKYIPPPPSPPRAPSPPRQTSPIRQGSPRQQLPLLERMEQMVSDIPIQPEMAVGSPPMQVDYYPSPPRRQPPLSPRMQQSHISGASPRTQESPGVAGYVTPQKRVVTEVISEEYYYEPYVEAATIEGDYGTVLDTSDIPDDENYEGTEDFMWMR